MPQEFNKFLAKDKIEIAQNLTKVVDPGKVYIGDYIGDAQKFVIDKKLMPSEQIDGDTVLYIAGGQNQFARIYYDGRSEDINYKTYLTESIYNFLPQRFKTYKPKG